VSWHAPLDVLYVPGLQGKHTEATAAPAAIWCQSHVSRHARRRGSYNHILPSAYPGPPSQPPRCGSMMIPLCNNYLLYPANYGEFAIRRLREPKCLSVPAFELTLSHILKQPSHPAPEKECLQQQGTSHTELYRNDGLHSCNQILQNKRDPFPSY
jgi:hypothetical protein